MPVCNAPYIRNGEGCCLDQDNDGICDAAPVETPEPPQIPEETTPEPTVPEPAPVEQPTPSEDEGTVYTDFMINYVPLKNEIRLLDQAIIQMEVENKLDQTATFLFIIDDDRWVVRSNPYMEPLRIGVRANDKNYFKLIIQPNTELIKEPGEYFIKVGVLAEKTDEKLNIEIPIIIK